MWLHVPRELRSASALESEGSISASPPPSEWSLWCTSSGTPSLRHVSWPGWKRRPWHQLLSGTTCAPSTLERGVAWWISSLAARRARISPSPGSGQDLTGSDPASSSSTSGFPSSARHLSSLGRTSPEQLGLFPVSASTLKTEAIAVPGPSFVRVTLAPLTSEPGSSSWPTPRASPNENRTTTNAPSHGNGHGKTLADEACDRTKALLWPTATATDAKASGSALYAKTGTHNPGTTLTDAAARLRTWPTPSARDWKGTLAHDKPPRNSRPLDEEASRFGLRLLTTEPDGPESSPPPPGSLQLNPLFVEWLMGLPLGWTDFAPLGTALCQPKPPTLGADSGERSSGNNAAPTEAA